MSEQINYATKLQEMEPPKGIVNWLQEQGALTKDYLIYGNGKYFDCLEDRMKTGVRVVCTHCGEVFFADKVFGPSCSRYATAPYGWYNYRTNEPVNSGYETVCPECGAKVKTYHVGNVGNGLYEWSSVAQIIRIPAEGKADRLALLDWRICRRANKEGQVTCEVHKRAAYVVEERKVVSLGGYGSIYYNTYFKELTQRARFVNDFGETKWVWPWDKALLIGTTAENSKLDLYIEAGGRRLVDWLALWRKKPQAENLLMQGYGRALVELLDKEKANGVPRLPEIDWREKKPARMMGMTTEEFRAYRGKLGGDELKALQWAHENGVELRRGIEDIRVITKLGTFSAENLLEAVGDRDFWRGAEYLKKQRQDAGTLRDYRRMAKRLGYDMENIQILWPKELKKAHDNVAVLYNKAKDATFDKRFNERAEELEKFRWEADGILIRPCASKEELRQEGIKMHHCVLSCADKIMDGATAIFFIRRKERPEEPWYTLELNEKMLTVRQNRGKYNCDRTPEIKAFEEAWVGWLKETFGEKKKKYTKKAGVPAA